MADNLILIGLVLILLQEILCSRKCDLVDVLIHFFHGHTEAVIGEGDRLIVGIHRHGNLKFHVLRLLPLSHDLKLL